MILKHHPKYEQIIIYLKANIDILSYQELIAMVYIKFKYRFSCQETLIYHLKQQSITKSNDKSKFRTKNIKGLRKIFERSMFRLEKLREGEKVE